MVLVEPTGFIHFFRSVLLHCKCRYADDGLLFGCPNGNCPRQHAAHMADSKHADMLTVIWSESPKVGDRSKYVHEDGRIILIYILKK